MVFGGSRAKTSDRDLTVKHTYLTALTVRSIWHIISEIEWFLRKYQAFATENTGGGSRIQKLQAFASTIAMNWSDVRHRREYHQNERL